jgi:hypothetical protein
MLIVKTELGHQVMKDRSVPLTHRQRAAFILFDGHRTLDEVLKATTVVGVTREDISRMFELRLLKDAEWEQRLAAAAAAEQAQAEAIAQHKRRTPQERYAEAYPIATALTASLGLRGLRLNLAVEAAVSYEELLQVAPRIRDAVGLERFAPLDDALNDR